MYLTLAHYFPLISLMTSDAWFRACQALCLAFARRCTQGKKSSDAPDEAFMQWWLVQGRAEYPYWSRLNDAQKLDLIEHALTSAVALDTIRELARSWFILTYVSRSQCIRGLPDRVGHIGYRCPKRQYPLTQDWWSYQKIIVRQRGVG